MTDLTAELAQTLKTIRRPGDFYVSGTFDLIPPGIHIDGFGPLSLPVLPDQAARLIAAATPAPFGRGEDTVIDTEVRRSWQIGPERVSIAGKRWGATLDAIVARAAAGLGAGDGVEAEFYKLLVYDAGSFFVSHRDTEKSPGMFATLVIALPSVSVGGDLVVRHSGRDVTVDMRSDDPGEARFAAFYADCLHEVRTVESGCRVTLIYNLIRDGRKPKPPRYESEEDRIVALLDGWREEAVSEGDAWPAKVVYPLDHAYTPAELSFTSLKGADAAAAGVLASAAKRAGCDLHLALLTIEESGSADYTGGGRSGRGRWREPDADDFAIGEIFDHSAMLTAWRGLGGETPGFGDMPVDEDDFSPPDVVEAMSPDEQQFHEATGNEGATLERTYRRAALVLWPTATFLPMIAAAGLPVCLPYLADLVGRHRRATGEERTAVARDVDELAGAVIARWPDGQTYGRSVETTSTTTLLDLLAAIEATGRIRDFLMRTDAAQGRSKPDNRAVIDALSALPPPDRVEVVAHLMGDGGPLWFAGCADLLARAARAWPDLRAAELREAARRLLVACPRDGVRTAGMPGHRLDDSVVENLLAGLCRIDPGLADEAIGVLLSSPDTFDMDGLMVPALRALVADPALAGASAVETLREACVAHLATRVALPLAPPADWTRGNRLTCTCADCSALAAFLADPTRETWSLKAAQPIRSHVETTILNSHCDVDRETLKKGTPHQLVLTKNQATYEGLARQRRADFAILAQVAPEAR